MEVDGWVVLNWLVGQKKPPPLVAVPSLSATEFAPPSPRSSLVALIASMETLLNIAGGTIPQALSHQ